eukprot:2079598-Pyramimonas_sp.AAC.1
MAAGVEASARSHTGGRLKYAVATLSLSKTGGELNSSVVIRLIKGLTGGELNSSVVNWLIKGLTGGELNSSV